MAFYDTAQDYLYDQFLLPLEKAIREGNKDEALRIAIFFSEKYIDLNAYAKGHENYVKDKYGDKLEMPIQEYVQKYVEPLRDMKLWKNCQTVYSIPGECAVDFDKLKED